MLILYITYIQGEEARVYEFIVRHFLACCSQDAKGFETTVEIDIASEKVSLVYQNVTLLNWMKKYAG